MSLNALLAGKLQYFGFVLPQNSNGRYSRQTPIYLL